jgi:hypothetical protein
MIWRNVDISLRKSWNRNYIYFNKDNKMNEDLDWSVVVKCGESHSNYLFETHSGRIEFIIIDTEMSQLNDYCVLCLNETAKKLQDLKEDAKEYKKGTKSVVVEPEQWDVTQDFVMGLEEIDIPAWEDNYLFVSKAMCMILLSTYTEKSLKSLCMAFSENEYLPKQKGGESKISAYVNYLKTICKFDLIEPIEFLELREECRKIRNNFAHGDWDDIRDELIKISLHQSFLAVSTLFQVLEEKIYPADCL